MFRGDKDDVIHKTHDQVVGCGKTTEYEKHEKYDDADMKENAELGTVKIHRYHFDDEAFFHPLYSSRFDPNRPYEIPIESLAIYQVINSFGNGRSLELSSINDNMMKLYCPRTITAVLAPIRYDHRCLLWIFTLLSSSLAVAIEPSSAVPPSPVVRASSSLFQWNTAAMSDNGLPKIGRMQHYRFPPFIKVVPLSTSIDVVSPSTVHFRFMEVLTLVLLPWSILSSFLTVPSSDESFLTVPSSDECGGFSGGLVTRSSSVSSRSTSSTFPFVEAPSSVPLLSPYPSLKLRPRSWRS
ncbi:hypothetical protein PIB30_072107 [Stylosanthes scabra]|uniref:Uncharacterized protein n=1 Tax=Stylosanthes scabra TaxID=79078 RepID=A0ABU6QP26_9FABA|nr:hypothetical protein [Stylosanthes scabra]